MENPMDPKLIKCFKASQPDEPVWADQKQINAHPETIIKWDRREDFLAKKKTDKLPDEKADEKPAGDEPKGKDEGEPDDTRTIAELQAELDEKGIAYTKRMTKPQLVELLK